MADKEKEPVTGLHIYNTDKQREEARAAHGLQSDRRLSLTSDKSRVVDATDPEARYLLVGEGGIIPQAEAERLNLTISGGKVTQSKPAEAQGNETAPVASEEEAKSLTAKWTAPPPPEIASNLAPEHTAPEQTPDGAVPASHQTSGVRPNSGVVSKTNKEGSTARKGADAAKPEEVVRDTDRKLQHAERAVAAREEWGGDPKAGEKARAKSLAETRKAIEEGRTRPGEVVTPAVAKQATKRGARKRG